MKKHIIKIDIKAAAQQFIAKIRNTLKNVCITEKGPSEEAVAARKRFDRANRISRQNLATQELFNKGPQLQTGSHGGSTGSGARFQQQEVRISSAKEHWFAAE